MHSRSHGAVAAGVSNRSQSTCVLTYLWVFVTLVGVTVMIAADADEARSAGERVCWFCLRNDLCSS
jgi:hypothetical protein